MMGRENVGLNSCPRSGLAGLLGLRGKHTMKAFWEFKMVNILEISRCVERNKIGLCEKYDVF